MIWEGYSKIRQLEKLSDGGGGGGGWVVFANNKDWQGQSIFVFDLRCVIFSM